jgi:hypothetical protein
MNKLVAAIRRTFADTYTEPPVHFHQGSNDHAPEVCYDGVCRRPHLQP